MCAEPVDIRKSIDELACLVEPLLGMSPFSGQVFAFVGNRRDKVKLLVWDRHGFWVPYKRLERRRFVDPQAIAASGISMSELTTWLEGIDLTCARRLRAIEVARLS
ncbi:MAG: IS66 family insertion sequence element accessory protein TnpB [Burkholderiales bacterium]|nr:IS66 family insertion sequence element accessory protein TnpB [Burkholderiales bacterium]